MSNATTTTKLTRLVLGDVGHAGGGGSEAAALGFSHITTVAPAAAFIPDGFVSLTSQSATSLVFAVRSGNTIYTFTNAVAEGV